MESLAPAALAEEWDNSGLQIGHNDWPVKKVWLALDPGIQVIESACRDSIDLLIAHHPLIFKPLKFVNLNSPVGKIIQIAIQNQLSVFSAHTNLDKVTNGINDVLAYKIGLKNIAVLENSGKGNKLRDSEKEYGLGRVGNLDDTIGLSALAMKIKERLGLTTLRVAGNTDLMVTRAAVCCGSGSSLMNHFFSSGAQVFISGDFKYHDARDAEAMNLGLIDIGHFASEHLILEVLVGRLREKFTKLNFDVSIKACKLEKDPFVLF